MTTEPLTNAEVDELVKTSGGWDVTKKHVRRIKDAVVEHFIPYWLAAVTLPATQRHDAFGVGIDPAVPEITRSDLTLNGNHVTREHDVGDVATLIGNGRHFNVDQRVLVVRDDPTKGYLVALRVQQWWHPGSVGHFGMPAFPSGWHMDIDAIKFVGEPSLPAELESHNHLMELLMLMRLAMAA